MSPPFLEVQVIQCNDPKLDILKILEDKANKRLDISLNWVGSDENPILRVDYNSEQAFYKTYTRDKLVYQTFVNFLQKRDLDLLELFPKQPIGNSDDSELYLTLKYTTDCKEPIRNNYNFTYKIIDYMGIKTSYEEVHDGFLLFYKTKQDFLDASMDLMDIPRIIDWLKEKDLWTDIMQEFFQFLQ
jgi:hypothetical protein